MEGSKEYNDKKRNFSKYIAKIIRSVPMFRRGGLSQGKTYITIKKKDLEQYMKLQHFINEDGVLPTSTTSTYSTSSPCSTFDAKTKEKRKVEVVKVEQVEQVEQVEEKSRVEIKEKISELEERKGRLISTEDLYNSISDLTKEQIQKQIEKLKQSGYLFEPKENFIQRLE